MTNDPAEQQPQQAAEKIATRLAQDARRREEITQREVQRQQPPFILEVEQSEVGYTMPPRLLPLSHVDFGALNAFLREKWSLVPDLSEVRIDPGAIKNLAPESIEEQVFSQIAKSRQGSIDYRSGRYVVTPSEFVPIVRVSFTFESLLVGVGSIGRVADALAQEVFEAISANAGVTRSWTQVQQEVQQVGYGTRTRVNLGSKAAFEKLLSPAVRNLIDTQMLAGDRFAAHSGPFHRRDDLQPPPDAVLNVALDDVRLRISRFNAETGMAVSTELRMSVTSRGDYHSGIVSVISEFPYDTHVKWVGTLIDVLNESE
jgi:hypothetical protein